MSFDEEDMSKWTFDWFKTIFYNIFHLVCFILGCIAFIQGMNFVMSYEDPVIGLFGVLGFLYLTVKWFTFVGHPQFFWKKKEVIKG